MNCKAWTRSPFRERSNIKLGILKDCAVLKQFLAVLDWMISEIKKKPVATRVQD